MPRKKHRVRTHETGTPPLRRPPSPAARTPAPPDREQSPTRGRNGLAPWLRATLVASLTLLGAALVALLFTESEAAAAARQSGASRVRAAAAPVEQRALVLDGRSALVFPDEVAYLGRMQEYTIECWARSAEPTAKHTLVGNRNYGGAGITWTAREGIAPRPTAWVHMSDVPGTRTAGYALLRSVRVPDRDDWTHLAVVVDARLARLYVDGRLAAEAVVGGRARASRLPMVVGADAGGTGGAEQYFVGELDDVRISLIARYDDEFVPPARLESDAHTSLLLDFEDPDAPFRDRSPMGLAARPVGAPRVTTTVR